MKKTGDIVRIGKNDYTIGERLGGGTEGNVFDFDSSNEKLYNKFVIKLLNEGKMSNRQRNETYEHLNWLKGKNTKDNEIIKYVVLPVEILASDLGYVMRKATGYSSLKDYIKVDLDDFDVWYKEKYTLRKRYDIIKSLFRALYTIHSNGMIFTDLSPNNILVNDTKNNIVFIDCDNMRRRTDIYNGILGTPGYMAPEIYKNADLSAKKINAGLGKNDEPIDPKILSDCGTITADSDIFSAAIIAFQLLTLQHPFIGDIVDQGTAEDEENAEKCMTDYIFKIGTKNTSTAMLTEYFEDVTTQEIRDLFYKTFVDGKDKPSLRPTDKDFYEAFARASDSIVVCPHCKFEQWYKDSSSRCCDPECNKEYGTKVIFEIYTKFRDVSRKELINQIGDFPELNVSDVSNFDFDGVTKDTKFLTSRIVLEPGIEKWLYLRHFESTMERNNKPCMNVKLLSEDNDYISISVNSDLIGNPKYSFILDEVKLYKKDGKYEFLEKGKQFTWENRLILFGQKKIGNSIMQVYGKFIRG